MQSVRVAVSGKPVPQGSMSVFNGRVVHQKGRELLSWRDSINSATREAMEPLAGPVEVSVLFYMPRPKGTRRTSPYVRPDIDKLARAVLDGLTGAAFEDDGQVTRLHLQKEYGEPGCVITISEAV
jgi:crossover junction endodeoxyribonuclease RusA